jgi:hypothetical protein
VVGGAVGATVGSIVAVGDGVSGVRVAVAVAEAGAGLGLGSDTVGRGHAENPTAPMTAPTTNAATTAATAFRFEITPQA